MQRTFRLAIVAIALVLVGVPARSADRGDDALWPSRWSRSAESPAKGVVANLDVAGLQPVRLSAGITRPSAVDLAAARALVGEDNEIALRFEGPGAFIYTSAEGRRRTRGPQAAFYFQFISGRQATGTAPSLAITRTWFAWYDPAPDAAREGPRAVVLLLPGMLGTPEPIIELFITRLQGAGCGVLRMMCQPSRFTERVVFDVDLNDPEPSARLLAEETAERLAECAYAVEAAFVHIAAKRSAVEGLPRIAIGMSGGAMILPTVVARQSDTYNAAIFIAGGANMMAILEDSNYKHMINAAEIRWSPAPPDVDERRRFDAIFLSLAGLDAYHTAQRLVGKPMLMIHGSLDMAVPAALGDLLWERLGKPDRWVEEAGHEELFVRLPPRMDEIIAWLEPHLAVRDR